MRPKRQQTMILIITMILLLQGGTAEEWYEPDSRMISDVEFQELVLKDRSAFKIVKYFSPHCQFCRYLKQVVDVLKHEKEWCFRIYDFNCAWYPQHCMANVRSSSFPYTAIHNQKGDLHEEIHGFYPEPVIRTIFDRIQQQCIASRQTPSSLSQESEAHGQQTQREPGLTDPPKEQNGGDNKGVAEAEQRERQVEKGQKKETAAEEPKPEQSIKQKQSRSLTIDEGEIDTEELQITIVPAGESEHQELSLYSTNHQLSSTGTYVKYAIYGITVLLAAYYFHRINKGKEIEDIHHAPPTHTHSDPSKDSAQETSPLLEHLHPAAQSAQVEAILQANSSLVANLPDEQL